MLLINGSYFTDILTPIRVALLAWTAVFFLLLFETLVQKPFQTRDLLTRGASFVVLAYSTYTAVVSTLGGGATWTRPSLSPARLLT